MREHKERVIIISDCPYPRGGAIANYIYHLALAIQYANYSVHIIAPINDEDERDKFAEKGNIVFHGFCTCKNRVVRHFTSRYGNVLPIHGIISKLNLQQNDIVYLQGKNPFVVNYLLKLKKRKKFRITAGIYELFAKEDYPDKNKEKKYLSVQKILFGRFLDFDFLMPISTLICKKYNEFGKRCLIVPPLADYDECTSITREDKSINFIIPANGKMKDSLSDMLRAFYLVAVKSKMNIYLHICGVSIENIGRILSEDEINRLGKHLVIHDWMSYKELQQLYQSTHFLLLAREISQMTLANFPSKVPETMTYGVIPIVSDVGDYTSLYLKDGYDSIYIKGVGCDACKTAIELAVHMSTAERYQICRNVRRTVKEKFDYRIWATKIDAFLSEGCDE